VGREARSCGVWKVLWRPPHLSCRGQSCSWPRDALSITCDMGRASNALHAPGFQAPTRALSINLSHIAGRGTLQRSGRLTPCCSGAHRQAPTSRRAAPLGALYPTFIMEAVWRNPLPATSLWLEDPYGSRIPKACGPLWFEDLWYARRADPYSSRICGAQGLRTPMVRGSVMRKDP